jgi:3-deoxy-D-manno-octulosonate 8-phosphate phosphatase (KDO 8-P phosphatase)
MGIKLVCCDIDGTLTDGTVFVSPAGEMFKQFSHRDGRAFHVLKESTGGNVRVALITSEQGGINETRADKLMKIGNITDYIQGAAGVDKQRAVIQLCEKYGINRADILFIGDDTNDLEAMEYCGRRACPSDALPSVKKSDRVIISNLPGGRGAVREIIDAFLEAGAFEGQEKNKELFQEG